MGATEHRVQGSGHAEEASYHNVWPDPDSSFCYLTEVADSEKLELVKTTDTEVGMHVADIGQRKCMDKGGMSYEP